MKILCSTSLLAPYRVDWLDELGKYADVDVYYTMDNDRTRNTQWCARRPKNCTYTLQKSRRLPKLGLVSLDVIKVLKDKAKTYDVILLDGYGFATQILNILYLNSRRLPYFVNIDGMLPREGEKRILRWLKRQLISRYPYCLCGAYATNTVLQDYGLKADRIINHPFSSLMAKDILPAPISQEQKKLLREKLGLPVDRKITIAVGQFIHRKGFDVLIEAWKSLPEDALLLVVGGGPLRPEYEQNKGSNVMLIDFLQKEELAQYYRAADLFVLPTREDIWGLVINEAMGYGLPVITTDRCVAGLDLVKNGENGYIVPVGDAQALADRTRQILDNDALREQMAQNTLETIRAYTVENMAKIHLEAFRKVLEG